MKSKTVRWSINLLGAVLATLGTAQAMAAGGLLAVQGAITAVDTVNDSFTLALPGPAGTMAPLLFFSDADTVIIKSGEAARPQDLMAGDDPVSVRYHMDGSRRLARWLFVGPWEGERVTGTLVRVNLLESEVAVQPEGALAADAVVDLTVTDQTLIAKGGGRGRLSDAQLGESVTADYTQEAGQRLAHVLEIYPAASLPPDGSAPPGAERLPAP